MIDTQTFVLLTGTSAVEVVMGEVRNAIPERGFALVAPGVDDEQTFTWSDSIGAPYRYIGGHDLVSGSLVATFLAPRDLRLRLTLLGWNLDGLPVEHYTDGLVIRARAFAGPTLKAIETEEQLRPRSRS